MKKLALAIALLLALRMSSFAGAYPVDETIRNLNIGTENPAGVWKPPGQVKMNGNPINGLPIAVQAGQPCTYGNVSGGCNNGGGGGGMGTVGSGTAGQLAGYPSNGTAVQGYGSNNHGLFAYESGSGPSTLAGSGAGQLLVWQASGDAAWLVMTGDVTINAGLVSKVSTINGITPGGTCSTHNWVQALTASVVPTCAQPSFGDLSGTLNLATQVTGLLSLTSNVGGVLPIANGGNGTNNPTLIAGSGITLTGSWPNYTIAAPSAGSPTTVSANAPLTSALGGNNYALSLTTPLAVNYGGSGTTTPSLIAGAGINISGSWPNQTIAAPAVGTVTAVTASAPLASSGGTTPAISLSGVVPIANGGTSCGSTPLFANLPSCTTTPYICSITDSSSCVEGTPVTIGGGSTFCTLTCLNSSWLPAGGAATASSGGFTAAGTGLGAAGATVSLAIPVTVAHGGTNATTPGATAANNIGAAALGANTDITSLGGLTTPLSKAQGGTGTTTPGAIAGANMTITGSFPNQTFAAAGISTPLTVAQGGTNATTAGPTAANNIGAARLGANSDITSLTGITTPIPVAEGGTGTASPGLVAGSNTTITGSWPNQTIASTGGGGGCGNTTLTTIAGTTAGSAACYTPCQGASLKTAVCNLSGYENTTGTAQVYIFDGGTTFSVLPTFALGNSNPPSAVGLTTISLPINQHTPFTGPVGVSGF